MIRNRNKTVSLGEDVVRPCSSLFCISGCKRRSEGKRYSVGGSDRPEVNPRRKRLECDLFLSHLTEQLFYSNNNMENCGPGYGTDVNVPVYATVKGVSVLNLIPHRYHSSLVRHRQWVGASLTYSSPLSSASLLLLPCSHRQRGQCFFDLSLNTIYLFGQSPRKVKMLSFRHYHRHSLFFSHILKMILN